MKILSRATTDSNHQLENLALHEKFSRFYSLPSSLPQKDTLHGVTQNSHWILQEEITPTAVGGAECANMPLCGANLSKSGLP